MATKKTPATKVVTGVVRLSYAHIWEKHQQVDDNGKPIGEPRYSTALLIPKSDKKTIEKLEKAIEAAKTDGKTSKWGGKLPRTLKLPLRDGDTDEAADGKPEYQGHYFMNCSTDMKPQIVDSNLDPIMEKDQVYSGCYCRVSVNMYPFNSNGNKGVAVGLGNILKVKDGERFGGGSTAEEDFGDLEDLDTDDFDNDDDDDANDANDLI